MSTLFEAANATDAAPQPLAERLRPEFLDGVVGQDHLLGADGPIGRMVASGRLVSTILWGPPGSGKTTIARLLARDTGLHFTQLSAVFSGVADLRRAFDEARVRRQDGQGTLLFVDEIHRFNRAQQDGFLPVVEDGTVILVGASAETALGRPLPLEPESRAALKAMADGDGRYVLNLAEELSDLPPTPRLDTAALAAAVQQRAPLYNKAQEGHYNLISALHKSLRGSDADAALYWLARMLAGGEDPLYIARRLVRFASEDVGLADPQALIQALAAKEAYDFVGSPEGELALAQCVIYLATAPKSNAAYRAFSGATTAAKESGSLMPPKHILNAPTRLMAEIGYAKGYRYDHDSAQAFSGQDYFPEGMARQEFYRPADRGFEREVQKRLAYWNNLRAKLAGDDADAG